MYRFAFQSGFFQRRSQLLFLVSLMMLFYALFDGLLSYLLPIQITSLGFSKSQMGLIIGSSNIFGLIFDFVLAKFITNTSYRRLYLIVFGLCSIYPLILWSSKTIPLFMLSMAIWGLYGDLNLFATFDFVSRRTKSEEHCKSFGIIGIFRSIGYLIAPLIAGLIVVDVITFFPYSLALSFVIMAIFFLVIILELSPKKDSPEYDHRARYRRYNIFKEFAVFRRLAQILFPVLLFNITLYIFDATFWTIGPIFSESFGNFTDFGGLFMAAYTLPVLLVNWFVNPITRRFGKKRTAYISFLVGSLFLLPVAFISQPFLIIGLVFISSLCSSLAWPAIDGAYADYISETKSHQKQIISLTDFTCNLGYIIGPIASGFIADMVGNQKVFLILPAFCVAIVIFLFTITPKHIRVT